MTKLLIFDCDGVLIDSEIISATQLIEALAPLGVHIDLAYVARKFLGRSYPMVMAQIRDEFGVDLPPAFEEAYRTRLLAAFERDLRVIPHVAEVIRALGVPYCVATSSSRPRATRSLEIAGLAPLFDERLFTASEVAHGKPAPDLFLHVARSYQIDPADCLVIEDSINGLLAARAAGMTAWHFTGGSHLSADAPAPPPEAAPDRTFASFADLPDLAPWLMAEGKHAHGQSD